VKYSARGYFELLELWWRSRRRRRWLSDVPGVLAKDNRNKGGNYRVWNRWVRMTTACNIALNMDAGRRCFAPLTGC